MSALRLLIPAAVMIALLCLLYRQGFLVTKSITAVLFFFQPGKDRDRLSLDSCSGWVRHRCQFHEGGTYVFHLDLQLSKGDVAVLLLDREKRELLRLDQQVPTGTVELKRKGWYYLCWEFKCVTGNCELR